MRTKMKFTRNEILFRHEKKNYLVFIANKIPVRVVFT